MGTPRKIHPAIVSLAQAIAPGSAPGFVRCEPTVGLPRNECFGIVRRRVQEAGGSAVIGWTIWEWPTILIEAEFHAVWQSTEGELVDLAPHDPPETRVLFLPDPNRTYQGRQVDNVRRPLQQRPEIVELIRIHGALFELMNKGDRAAMHGAITLDWAEEIECGLLHARLRALTATLTHMPPRPGRNERCYCDSGRKFKHCCGSDQGS
jgi:hypothetical protein